MASCSLSVKWRDKITTWWLNSPLALAFCWVHKHWLAWITMQICDIWYPSSSGRPASGQGEAQFFRILTWLCLSNPGSSGVQEVQYCGAGKFNLLLNGLKIFTRCLVNVWNLDHIIGTSKTWKIVSCDNESQESRYIDVLFLFSLIFSLSLPHTSPFLLNPPFSLCSYEFSFFLFLYFLSSTFSPTISPSTFYLILLFSFLSCFHKTFENTCHLLGTMLGTHVSYTQWLPILLFLFLSSLMFSA